MKRGVIVLAVGVITAMAFNLAFAQGGWQLVWTTARTDTVLKGGPGRGLIAGTDLDKDGKKEVIITNYLDHKVEVFEAVANNTLEKVWVAASTPSAYYSEPRWVQTGDLDKNGKPEIIFPVGRTAADTARGYHIYEWDGATDNAYGTAPIARFVPDPNMVRFRPENFLVADVDYDGQQEVVDLGFGFSGTEDAIRILSISGEFSSGFYVVNEEFKFETGNLPGGQDFAACSYGLADTDGDGKKEVWIIGNGVSTVNTAIMNIESTGPDTYVASPVIMHVEDDNNYALKNPLVVADFDADGKEEFYFPKYLTQSLWVTTGITDASQISDANIKKIGTYTDKVLFGMDRFSDASGRKVFFSTGYDTGPWQFTYKGGPVTDSTSYEVTHVYSDPFDGSINGDPGITGGFSARHDDLDNDGLFDLVLAYQGVPDSMHHLRLRVIEETPTGVRQDWRIITPDDYKLAQNYPNPFNATTAIQFTLPLRKRISLKIYNSFGQVVRTLINDVEYTPGTHRVQWDATDDRGAPVVSGVYVYVLEFGNFRHSRTMTLVR